MLLQQLNNWSRNEWVKAEIERTKNQIWKSKTRSGLKIDLGMCYENESQILHYYGSDERQLAILNKLLLIKSSFDESIFDDPNLGRIFVEEPSNAKKIMQFLIKFTLWILSPIIYPIAILQILWNIIKHNQNPNHKVTFKFCTFFPHLPEERFLTKLD